MTNIAAKIREVRSKVKFRSFSGLLNLLLKLQPEVFLGAQIESAFMTPKRTFSNLIPLHMTFVATVARYLVNCAHSTKMYSAECTLLITSSTIQHILLPQCKFSILQFHVTLARQYLSYIRSLRRWIFEHCAPVPDAFLHYPEHVKGLRKRAMWGFLLSITAWCCEVFFR